MATRGRPTEYDPKVHPALVLKYLASCVDEYPGMRKKVITEKGKKKVIYEKTRFRVNIPTIEELSLELNINVDTIYAWEKKHEEFSEVIERVRKTQAARLAKGGLAGDYNPTITKLMMHKHGWRDAQEITGAEGKDLIPDNESKEKSQKAIAAYLNKSKKKQ